MSNQWEGKLWYAYGTSMTSVQQGKFVPVVEKLSGLKVKRDKNEQIYSLSVFP